MIHLAAAQGLADDIREDVLIACLLHDTLEDVLERYSAQQMEQDFGPHVLNIVRGVTKDDSLDSWRERSDAYLDHLRGVSEVSAIGSACDRLHNLSSILPTMMLMAKSCGRGSIAVNQTNSGGMGPSFPL